MAKRRVSDTEYSGAWWAGFRGAVYEQDQNLGRSNINAIALAMEGSPIEQDSYGETVAYRRGYKKGNEMKALFRIGKFPDLENALRGGSVLATGIDAVQDTALDVLSDPVGESADLLDTLMGLF